MITHMRHQLVLSLYATIGVGGLIVAGIGLFGCGGVLFVALAANASGMADMSGFRFDYALALAGGWLVLASVGGVIAWFGLKTWYHRRRAGPAPDDASVPRSSFGRALAAIVFGGFALYAGYTLLHMFGHNGRDAVLAAFGTTVEGRVTAYQPAPDVHPDVVRVHFEFDALDGDVVEGSRNHWSWAVDTFRKTNTVPVTYLPGGPAFHLMDHSFDLDDTLALFGQYFAVLAVGVWGFGKNTGLWNSRPPAAPMGTPPPVIPVPRAEFTQAVRRSTFGRRGF